MRILLLVEAVFIMILYVLSRGKFKETVKKTDESEKLLRAALPVGLIMLALFRHRYSTRYEQKLEAKLRILKGEEAAHEFLKIHMAGKLVTVLAALVFLTFVGTQVEVDSIYVFFSITLLAGLFIASDRQLDNSVKERQRSIQLEFPEFLNKLILLVNAGLTVNGAILRIVKDCENKNPFYKELGSALNSMNTGKSEIQAYEDFARHCRSHEVTTFVSILIQNIRKGNAELIPILRLQASTSWENRKNLARKMGEEAATKLLFPMVIVFIAILIMVMTPAILQIQI